MSVFRLKRVEMENLLHIYNNLTNIYNVWLFRYYIMKYITIDIKAPSSFYASNYLLFG